jgi:hypothetical protein
MKQSVDGPVDCLQEISNFNKSRSHWVAEIYFGEEFFLDAFEREIEWIKHEAFDLFFNAYFCFSDGNRETLSVVFPNPGTSSQDRDREIL